MPLQPILFGGSFHASGHRKLAHSTGSASEHCHRDSRRSRLGLFVRSGPPRAKTRRGQHALSRGGRHGARQRECALPNEWCSETARSRPPPYIDVAEVLHGGAPTTPSLLIAGDSTCRIPHLDLYGFLMRSASAEGRESRREFACLELRLSECLHASHTVPPPPGNVPRLPPPARPLAGCKKYVRPRGECNRTYTVYRNRSEY